MALPRTTVIPTLAVALLLSGISESLAGPGHEYVTARSDFGNGTARAPVRRAQYGYQVKLPGGSWLYCKQNRLLSRGDPCADTLRSQHLDFWETQLDDHGGNR